LRAALPHLFIGLESIAAITLGTPRETRGLLAITRSGEMASEEQCLFSAIAETVTHALNYADLNEWIARQNEHIAALVSMYSTLAGSSDPAEMHALLAQSIFDLLPDIAEVAIDRYDPHLCQIQRAYTGAYGSGQVAPADQPARLDSRGWLLQSQVIHSCNALICNDLREYLKTQPVEAARPPGDPLPQSALCVPLLTKDKVIGLITVTSYSLQRFSPGDLDVLTHLAGAAALALENARLRELLETPSITQH
jgi:GAF domain-containing protein